jgi:DNA (cytosine-5)-methyltransferase 1
LWQGGTLKLRIVSLFSGCGGSDLGAINAGHKIIWANDILPVAKQTYLDNIPNVKYECKDIREIKQFPNADMLIGCYPCQGYTQGGRRVENDERNYLYREFLRCLRTTSPKFFVAENVSGMQKLFGGKFLRNQIYAYRAAGYRVTWASLDAKAFGVPQDRKRIFICGIRSDLGLAYTFPDATHGEGKLPYVTLKEAIGDLYKTNPWPKGEFDDSKFHWYYLSRNRKRGWHDVSYTIVANWRHVPLHPMGEPMFFISNDKWGLPKGRHRRLSYTECARIQGFPDSFKFNYGRIEERFKLIGNAVPPLLFQRIVEAFPKI